jgi:hypothetical protein
VFPPDRYKAKNLLTPLDEKTARAISLSAFFCVPGCTEHRGSGALSPQTDRREPPHSANARDEERAKCA